MTGFDWFQLGIDTALIIIIGIHCHPITWRRRR